MFQMQNKIVGVDLDGVISDIVAQLVRFSRNQFGIEMAASDIQSESIETCTPINLKQLTQIFRQPTFFRSMRAVQGARRSLRELSSRGYTIHIVTDRFWYPQVQADTRRWLSDRLIAVESVSFARKTEKQHVARELGIGWFIEDQLSNANLLSEVCRVLLVDRSYNRGAVCPHVLRVSGIGEAVDCILGSFVEEGGRRLKPLERVTSVS